MSGVKTSSNNMVAFIFVLVMLWSLPSAVHAEINIHDMDINSHYREVQQQDVAYNTEMHIVSDGKGYFYQLIDGKYYPVETRYGSTYGYGGYYIYNPEYRKTKERKAPQRKQKQEESSRESWVKSSSEYPIFFN